MGNETLNWDGLIEAKNTKSIAKLRIRVKRAIR